MPIEEVDLIEDPERELAQGVVSPHAAVCIADDGYRQILYLDLGTEVTERGLLQRYDVRAKAQSGQS